MEKIKIKNPCHADWDKMSEDEKGKFCQHCNKTVVDFTEKSLEEVFDFIRKNKNESCGKFRNDQLNQKTDSQKRTFYFPPLLKKAASISLIGVSTFGIPILVHGQDIIEKIEVPAEYDSIQVKKIKKPATVISIEIPAEYDTFQVKKLVKPEEVKIIEIPAEYITIEKRVIVTKGGYAEWREIDCVLPEIPLPIEVKVLQKRLKEIGYYNGDINNVLCDKTKQALIQYREDHKMVAIFEIDDEVMEALGIKPY